MSGAPLPPPRLRDDFRKRLRAELMNEAVALAEERRSHSFASRVRWLAAGPRLRAVVVVGTLVVMLVAGAGAAAAGSLPGDPAFGLKRAAEELQVTLAPSAEAKVQLLAEQTQHRLGELTAAADRADRAPTASAEYEAAVQRFAAAVEAIRRAEPGAKHEAVDQVVKEAREKDLPLLEDLRERVPANAKEGIERAIDAQEKLAPTAAPGQRTPGPRATKSPDRDDRSAAPTTRETERPRVTSSPRPTETEEPRATETPRGGHPTETPHR